MLERPKGNIYFPPLEGGFERGEEVAKNDRMADFDITQKKLLKNAVDRLKTQDNKDLEQELIEEQKKLLLELQRLTEAMESD